MNDEGEDDDSFPMVTKQPQATSSMTTPMPATDTFDTPYSVTADHNGRYTTKRPQSTSEKQATYPSFHKVFPRDPQDEEGDERLGETPRGSGRGDPSSYVGRYLNMMDQLSPSMVTFRLHQIFDIFKTPPPPVESKGTESFLS